MSIEIYTINDGQWYYAVEAGYAADTLLAGEGESPQTAYENRTMTRWQSCYWTADSADEEFMLHNIFDDVPDDDFVFLGFFGAEDFAEPDQEEAWRRNEC